MSAMLALSCSRVSLAHDRVYHLLPLLRGFHIEACTSSNTCCFCVDIEFFSCFKKIKYFLVIEHLDRLRVKICSLVADISNSISIFDYWTKLITVSFA